MCCMGRRINMRGCFGIWRRKGGKMGEMGLRRAGLWRARLIAMSRLDTILNKYKWILKILYRKLLIFNKSNLRN